MSLKAALEALSHDAGVWDEVSAVTSRAAQQADVLSLSESDLSWSSRATGFLDTYAAIQQKVGRLLREGSAVYSGLSATLTDVRQQYQANDERAAHKLEGVWDVRE